MRTSLLCGLVLTASAVAQEAPPRVEAPINSTFAAIGADNSIRVSAPKEILPADPSNGLAATPNVVYAAYPDVELNNPANPQAAQPAIAFRRSTDGGLSFEPQVFPFVGPFAAGSPRGDRFRLISCGHEVYLIFLSTLSNPNDPLSGDGVQRMYVAGSQDQGQNWQIVQVDTGVDAPLSTGDRFSKVGDFYGADCSTGRLHIVFLGNYDSGTGNTLGFAVGNSGPSRFNEDNYYQALSFTPGGTLVRVFPEERQIEVGIPTGLFDSDNAIVSADAQAVTFAYQDTSAGTSFGNSTNNDTYSVSSLDGGLNLTAPFNHTNFMGNGNSIDFFTQSDVRGAEVLVTMQHNEDGGPGGTFADQAFFSYSSDGGQTFTTVKQLGFQSGGDLDAHNVNFVGADKVWFSAEDQLISTGTSGSNDDEIAVQVSTVADLVAGTNLTPVLVSRGLAAGNSAFLYRQDHFGDTLAVCWRSDNLGYAGWTYAVSSDCGANWKLFDGDDDPNGTSVDGDIAVSTSSDIVSIHREDDFGAFNAFVSGLKLPYLVDNSATTLSIDLKCGRPGDTMFLLPSLDTTGGPFALPPTVMTEVGVVLNFSPDAALTGALLGNPIFINTVDASGNSSFFFTNFATILGQDIAVMAASVIPGGTWTRRYTNQIIQNP